MRFRFQSVGIAFALLLAAGMVHAQQPPAQAPMNPKEAKARFAEKFAAADADHDGKLTRAEAEAGMPEVAKNFDKIDTKKKGYVTQKQIGAYFAARMKDQRAKDPGSLN